MFYSQVTNFEGRAPYTGPRVVVIAPVRESRRRTGKWVRVRCNTVMPEARDLIEVRMACGAVHQGRSGDFLWVMADGSPGKIVEFRILP